MKMKAFMNEDFLLSNETARRLYHDYAAKMPIIDYHCHIDPREIAEDRRFETITQVWLGGDHYKWRQMRSNGVEERYITGDAPDREKFQKYAEMLPRAIGNPLYHWTHLELQRYFGYFGALSGETAEEVWNLCNQKLQEPGMSARGLIAQSNVRLVATTDDPVDSLEWHQKIREDASCPAKVVPAWRPDKAVNLEKPGFAGYIAKLAEVGGKEIATVDDLLAALDARLDYFDKMGCRAADHGLDYMVYEEAPYSEINEAFQKALAGKPLTLHETEAYKTALVLALGRGYAKRGWVMQLHFGALRNTNTAMFRKIGADTGYDCMAFHPGTDALAKLLDALEITGELPKTVVYSLNPVENQAIDTIIGAFQGAGVHGKIQHGAAWWFNDTKSGMTEHLTSLANLSILGNFIGMLTDSRSLLSYTRHEYFRRILCNLIGGWVENGEYPNDVEFLGKMVQDISYNNTKAYFGFDC